MTLRNTRTAAFAVAAYWLAGLLVAVGHVLLSVRPFGGSADAPGEDGLVRAVQAIVELGAGATLLVPAVLWLAAAIRLGGRRRSGRSLLIAAAVYGTVNAAALVLVAWALAPWPPTYGYLALGSVLGLAVLPLATRPELLAELTVAG
ncbi:hypothetical protein [Kitasatospora terrestris]|uniref:Uncharacterized protein n=1 Tax=Kitasatospora terrestris TaxID=258051 RepID=A0ABP9DUI7_9ACTN